MFNLKTHFAQVPLEIVQRIVDEQILKEATSQTDQPIEDETLSEDVQEVEGPFIGRTGSRCPRRSY